MKNKHYEQHLRALSKESIPSFETLFPSYKKPKRWPGWQKRFVFAPVLTILIFTLAVWFFQPSEPTFSTLYLEINPSLQITIDDNEVIVDVIPLNDDASNLPLRSYIDLSYDDFLDQWFKDVAERLEWDEDRLILFDVIGENATLNEKLAQRLESTLNSHPLFTEHPATVMRQHMGALSKPELDAARNLGIGLMRYRLAQAIADENEDLTFEEILDLPVRDLIQRRPEPPVQPSPPGRPSIFPPRR